MILQDGSNASTPAAGGSRASLERHLMVIVWPAAGIIGSVLVWQSAVSFLNPPALILPSPLSVWQALVSFRQLLVHGAWVTFEETILGFLLAVAIGVPLAVLLSEVHVFHQILYPLLVVAQSIPKPAIAPLVLVWLGFGLPPKLAVSFLVAFFPIVVDTVTGLRAVEPEFLELMASLRARRLQTLLVVKLPSALPHVFSGFKVAITLALIGAVVAEFVGSTAGLGNIVLSSTSQSETSLTFAALVLLGVIGILLFEALQLFEAVAIPWAFRRSAR